MFGGRLDRFKRTFDDGETIFEEGDWGDAIIIIKEGQVRISKESGGADRLVATAGSGDFIGEMSLAEGRHQRTATVTADGTVKGWKLSKNQFEDVIGKNEAFRKKLIQAFVDRLSETTTKLSEERDQDPLLLDLSFHLLGLLDMEEWEDPDTKKTLEVNLSPDYIAYHFGASDEIVEKYLALQDGADISDMDQETVDKLIKLGQRIIDESIEKIQPELQAEQESDPDLVRTVRRASDHLETLEEEAEEMSSGDLQDILQDRKDFKAELDHQKEQGRDDFLVQRLEMLVNSIEREVNKLHRS